MTGADATLATLVAARLCHDLISPVGAIGNGLELMRLTEDPTEELALVGESLAHAEARLKFFRIAFGSTGPGQEIAAAALRDLLDALAGSRRATLDWQVTAPVPRDEAQLALLGLMCLEAAMPWGGTVTLAQGDAGWRLSGSAPRLRIDPAAWAALEDATAPVTAAQVEFALLPALLRARGRNLRHRIGETAISLSY